MTRRKLAAAIAAGAVAAAGTGVAVGAVSDDAKKTEDAILDRAAKQLNVTPEALRDALGTAEDAQLDQAVEDGKLTQEQADAIKQHRQGEGRVLGLGGRPGERGGHAFGRGPGFGPFDGVAKALGLSERQLMNRLRKGRTLAQIAKAQGKDLADVKAAAKAAAKKRLDAAVEDGKLTQAQADDLLSRFDEHFDRLAAGDGPDFRGRGHGPGGDHDGPPPGAPAAPGAYPAPPAPSYGA